MNALYRLTPYLIAAALPLLLFAWFMPRGATQIDMALMWLVAMVVVALPMLFLELALATRSQAMPWQGMQKLTRESDAPLYWRSFVGLSVLLSIVMAAFLLSSLVIRLKTVGIMPDVPSYVLTGVLMGVALIASVLKQRLLAVGVVLIVLSGLLNVVINPTFQFVMTQTDLSEWAVAVVLALFSVGVGTGLYWFGDSAASGVRKQGVSLAGAVLPIWLEQLVFGVLALVILSVPVAPVAVMTSVLGVLMVAAFLLYYAGSQLMARFGIVMGASMTAVVALILAVLPASLTHMLLTVIGLVAALILAVFSGWLMKISHLRKSLNFTSEARYNLWRVAVRWLVPLAIVAALVGWVMSLLGRM